MLGGEYGGEGEFDYRVNEEETGVKGMGSLWIAYIFQESTGMYSLRWPNPLSKPLDIEVLPMLAQTSG